MKTSLEDQIEEMNARIRDSKELLKLFFNGEEYYKQRIKKLKTEFGQTALQQQFESIDVNELKAKIEDMTGQVQALKKFKPMISIYNDGDERTITLDNVQQFVLSLFGANLYEVDFSLIKNPDRLARVCVFVVEDERLGRLVFDRTSPNFEHHIKFADDENWCQNFLKVTFKKAPTDYETKRERPMANGEPATTGLTNGQAATIRGSPTISSKNQSNRSEPVIQNNKVNIHSTQPNKSNYSKRKPFTRKGKFFRRTLFLPHSNHFSPIPQIFFSPSSS